MANQHARALGKLGGANRHKIPKEKRVEIARKGAQARWKNHKKKHPSSH